MSRRRAFLAGSLALAGAAAAAAWKFWPDEGLWNPCRAPLPAHLAGHPLVEAAWEGLDAERVWDSHAHLIGAGDSESGIRVNPRMDSLLDPVQYARRLVFLNAGCVEGNAGVDRAYVARTRGLLEGMRAGVKMLLFAFERVYDERGRPDEDRTEFHVPDAYARDVAHRHPHHFEWVASIHPYRPDALEALERAAREGARAVKWLPSAMGIDPGSYRCDAFYAALARLDLPLITHAGLERAVPGVDRQDFGNPLRLRRPLEAGVRVVVAHCASMGTDRDLDAGPDGPRVESFALFARLMDDARYAGLVFGDISAMTQVSRAGPALKTVLERRDWHPRLLNGSDYPLPGVMPIFSVDHLVSLGMLAPDAAPVLREIRTHNPLLYDFVTKRSLRLGTQRLSSSVFETRGFFVRAAKPLAAARS